MSKLVLTRSFFYYEGYNDAIELRKPALPGASFANPLAYCVADEEYLDGYCVAINIVQDVLQIGRDAVRFVAEKGANHDKNA